jgi:hypothetical protein
MLSVVSCVRETAYLKASEEHNFQVSENSAQENIGS